MNQASPSKIKLFPEILSCQDCLFSWEGYVHGFSRGHAVLRKNEKILFIPDDLAYCFPRAGSFNFKEAFEREGWRDLESCPKCGANNLFPPTYDQEKMEDVECIFIESEDLNVRDEIWVISETGRIKLNSSEQGASHNERKRSS